MYIYFNVWSQFICAELKWSSINIRYVWLKHPFLLLEVSGIVGRRSTISKVLYLHAKCRLTFITTCIIFQMCNVISNGDTPFFRHVYYRSNGAGRHPDSPTMFDIMLDTTVQWWARSWGKENKSLQTWMRSVPMDDIHTVRMEIKDHSFRFVSLSGHFTAQILETSNCVFHTSNLTQLHIMPKQHI